jgi:DNA adenine methylase
MSQPVVPSRMMLDIWYARIGKARPFIKWAGGKQAFVFRFASRLPNFTGKYIEPFLGSGAVFFHLMRRRDRPFPSVLGDTNKHLISCFIAVRDDAEGVAAGLEELQAAYVLAADKAGFYYDVRERANASFARVDPAVFIFLNRTCWNGLYRINTDGRFNVPFGAPKTDRVTPTREDLLNAAAALAEAELRAASWENTVVLAEPGDFVFLDPPYFSELKNKDGRTTKYSKRKFDVRHHDELATALSDLQDRGVEFLLTNSAEDEMVELYASHNLTVERVELPRAINSKTDQRTAAPEIIVSPGIRGGSTNAQLIEARRRAMDEALEKARVSAG